MRKHYSKLVRDRIPEIIEAEGKRCQLETLDDEAYFAALIEKLSEEARELAAAPPHKQKGELADILEVLDALIKLFGYNRDEILKEQYKKRSERGGFDRRIKLLWVEQS